MLMCPFCRLSILEGKPCVSCPVCSRKYHAECWDANKMHCSVLGCMGGGPVNITVYTSEYVTVKVADSSGSKTVTASVPSNAPMSRLLPALVKKIGLPDGTYQAFHWESGKNLRQGETLNELGVKDNDHLRLLQNVVAGCFPLGTKVQLPGGRLRQIEQLVIDNNVLTYDLSKSRLAQSPIVKLFTASTLELFIINHTLHITGSHLVFANGQWLPAYQVKLGDHLTDTSGNLVVVKSFERQTFSEPVPVYNLHLLHDHTFFAEGILVHNGQSKLEMIGKSLENEDVIIITEDDLPARQKIDLTNHNDIVVELQENPQIEIIDADVITDELSIHLEDKVLEKMNKERNNNQPRYFNCYFIAPNGKEIIPDTKPLIFDQNYFLGVVVSPEKRGLGLSDVPFPDGSLEKLWEKDQLHLTVVVTSRDFKIEPRWQTLLLPRWETSKEIRFSVQPRIKQDRGYIQIELFYRGFLLQSKRVEAWVSATIDSPIPPSVRAAQSAQTTFTTSTRLFPETLSQLPERVFTVNVERDSRDGSFAFRYIDRTREDAELAFYDTRLQPEMLGNAVVGLRNQLKLMVSGKEKGYAYNLSPSGDYELLNIWLPRLAQIGHSLYRSLLPENRLKKSTEQVEAQLPAILEQGSVLQINPVVGLVTIPWAALYERRIKYVPGRSMVCKQFADCTTDYKTCNQSNDDYVICPYAFWGYRYVIEQLPCWSSSELPQPPDVIHHIKNESPLCMNFNVHKGIKNWNEHQRSISKLGQIEILTAKSIAELEIIWRDCNDRLDFIYFLVHANLDSVIKEHFLDLSGEPIYSNFLNASQAKWPHNPLVFLNGCGTGDYGLESFISIIDELRASGASGVIGTECSVPTIFAEAYAEVLLKRFFRSEHLGQAMLAVRLEFLRENLNPLGLIYTLYASNEIALANSIQI